MPREEQVSLQISVLNTNPRKAKSTVSLICNVTSSYKLTVSHQPSLIETPRKLLLQLTHVRLVQVQVLIYVWNNGFGSATWASSHPNKFITQSKRQRKIKALLATEKHLLPFQNFQLSEFYRKKNNWNQENKLAIMKDSNWKISPLLFLKKFQRPNSK